MTATRSKCLSGSANNTGLPAAWSRLAPSYAEYVTQTRPRSRSFRLVGKCIIDQLNRPTNQQLFTWTRISLPWSLSRARILLEFLVEFEWKRWIWSIVYYDFEMIFTRRLKLFLIHTAVQELWNNFKSWEDILGICSIFVWNERKGGNFWYF